MKYLIIVVCILIGCANKPVKISKSGKEGNMLQSDERHDLPMVDISKEYPPKLLYVQDIADVEYVPLETNDSTLVGLVRPDAVSEHYIVYHNRDGRILVFNRQGKRVYSFNYRGGSNEEYSCIYDIMLDEEKNELYVEEYGVCTKIYVYSLDGTFKRRFALPEKYQPAWLLDYDKDVLFCYNQYGLDRTDQLNVGDTKQRDNPYFFISKHTGEITPFDYHIPGRIGNQLCMKEGDYFRVYQINIEPLVQNKPDILICEFADDTIFSLKDRKLLPVMVKTPSVLKMASPMMVAVDFFTDKYLFLRAVERKFDGTTPKQNERVYDKHSNSFYQMELLNKDYSCKRCIGSPLQGGGHNMGVNVLPTQFLIRDYKAGKLKGELKQIASKLKEDDNPVVMLVKFKE